jgi:hypothetical protein
LENLPKEIYAVRRYLRGSNPVMTRMVLTLTRIYETLYIKPKIDLEAILTPYQGRLGFNRAINHYERFLTKITWKRFGTYSIKPSQKFITRSKAGPNGPSIPASQLDTLAVYQDKRLFNAMMKWNDLLGQT